MEPVLNPRAASLLAVGAIGVLFAAVLGVNAARASEPGDKLVLGLVATILTLVSLASLVAGWRAHRRQT